MTIEALKIQYSDIVGRAERMRDAVSDQLSRLIDDADVTLGVPMESRVKKWASIEEKIERKRLKVDDLCVLPDFIGIRTILLFRTDLNRTDKLIRDTFEVLSSEDTSDRLGEAQFGYQSLHYNIKIPASWLSIPSMADFGDLQVEIQVRTLAQHIWAAASHKLQYKDEASVPPPIRRAINRASALLETVDLEFERVLSERREYKETGIPAGNDSEVLNVDLLASVLASILPSQNKSDDEDYGELLGNLTALEIKTVADLERILTTHFDEIMKNDRMHQELREGDDNPIGTTKERNDAGVFFTHVGLTREALGLEFGEDETQEVISES